MHFNFNNILVHLVSFNHNGYTETDKDDNQYNLYEILNWFLVVHEIVKIFFKNFE